MTALRLASIFVVALVVGGVVAAVSWNFRNEADDEPNGTKSEAGFALWAFNVDDERELVANSDDAFVGTVLDDLGSLRPPRFLVPITQFSVQIEAVIKGSLSGDVTVVQWGGIDPDTGELILNRRDPLLTIGRRYLFATVRGNASLGINGEAIVASGYGNRLIADSAHELELINLFRTAVGLPEVTPTATGSPTPTPTETPAPTATETDHM